MWPMKNPQQYELWADLSLQNKHLRRNNWFHWSAHLILVVFLCLMATRPLAVIRVDKLGHADLLTNVPARPEAPAPEEAEAVAELVSEHLLELTSGSISRDLGKGLALMTPKFAAAYREKAMKDKTLAELEHANVRTNLSFDDKLTKVEAEKSDKGYITRYFVTLIGRLDVYRQDVNTSPLLTKHVQIRTTLLVVPRTPRTLNGLLVDYFDKRFLETDASQQLDVSPLPTAPAKDTH